MQASVSATSTQPVSIVLPCDRGDSYNSNPIARYPCRSIDYSCKNLSIQRINVDLAMLPAGKLHMVHIMIMDELKFHEAQSYRIATEAHQHTVDL